MHRFWILLISLFAFALTACPPAPPAPPAEVTASSTTAGATGAGGDAGPADAATSSAATSAETSTSAFTGGLPAGCVGPEPRHKVCDNPGDCYDSSACTEDICDLGTPPDPPDPFGRKGTCLWKLIADGTPCDVSPGRDTCQAGACCPDADEPGATTARLPEAR
jgi:hypothetical protein